MNKVKLSNYLIEYPELSVFSKINEIIKNNILYEDNNFSKINTNIIKNNCEYLEFKGIIWKKINTKWHSIIPKKFENCNLNIINNSLNNLNNCLNLLKENPDLILRIIEFKSFNNSEVFGVWLNVNNNWRLVPWDSNFPMIKKNDNYLFSFSSTSDLSIWNILIEKAMAKALGSYYEITNKSVHELLFILTGINNYNFLLKNSNIVFNKIKEELCKNNIVSTFKTSKFNNGILENLKFNYYYIIHDFIDKDFDKKIILKKEIELEEYESSNKTTCIINWLDFLEEFEYISILDNSLKYINNFRIDNENISLFKIFIYKKTTIDINISQSCYDNDQINLGIVNWKHPQKKNKFDRQENITSNLNFIPNRKERIVEKYSNQEIIISKINSNYSISYVIDYSFKKKLNTMNLNLKKGEYLIYIKSDWLYSDLLNSIYIQINSSNLIDLQNIENISNSMAKLMKDSYFNKYLKDEENIRNYEIIDIKNKYKVYLNKLNNDECQNIFYFNTYDNIFLKIKYRIADSEEEFNIDIYKKYQSLIYLDHIDELIEFLDYEFYDISNYNIDLKYLYSIQKYKDFNNYYYLVNDEFEEGCNCIIF